MYEITSDLDIDQIVWSIIKDSNNADDYLDYLRHTQDRKAGQEEAFEAALRCWGGPEAPRLFGKAVEALESLAHDGNTCAMFHLGRWYRLGYGVAVDSARGIGWYERGVKAGSSKCMINLARSMATSDPQAAANLYERAVVELGDMSAHCYWADIDKDNHDSHIELAASHGDAYSLCFLAELRLSKLNPDEDPQPCLDLLHKSADKGASYACIRLGQIHKDGLHGQEVDEDLAKLWFKEGASLGNELACAIYGKYCLDSDEADALIYLQRAAMLGEAIGQAELGNHLAWNGKTAELQATGAEWLRASAKQGYISAFGKLALVLDEKPELEAQPEEQLHWLKKGHEKGLADCQTQLGLYYMRRNPFEGALEEAHNLFQIASLQGHTRAMYFLGQSFKSGHGVEVDLEQAFRCFLSAANDRLVIAALRVGVAYMIGQGVQKNYAAGAKWLKKAADAGHGDAQAYLGVMFSCGYGVEINNEIALKWLKSAAKLESPMGLRELGLLYEAGLVVEQDMEKAAKLMAKAASLGDEEAVRWIEEKFPDKPAWLRDLAQLADKTLPEEGKGSEN